MHIFVFRITHVLSTNSIVCQGLILYAILVMHLLSFGLVHILREGDMQRSVLESGSIFRLGL